MTDRDPQFDAYVMKIFGVLDRLDYYRLLGVQHDADISTIKKAYYAIAKKFHPDRNRSADPAVTKALYAIYKRINEAYKALIDGDKRKFYDKLLAKGAVRIDQDIHHAQIPRNPGDTIQSPKARQFYLQARTELEKGNLMQADLHIKVAFSREKSNEEIAALVARITEAKRQQKASRNQ
jgi:curved DNA-binding protein CbpA